MHLQQHFTRAAIGLLAAVMFAPVLAHPVIGIADGDTLTVLVNQKPVKIRLANIDAPERRQAFGTRSRQSLADLCWGQEAKFEVQDVDRYKRVVGVVYCDGVNVNRAQVERGMAWVYPRYNKDRALPLLQEQAREERRGLWGMGRDPVPPWEWRRERARS